MAQSAVAGAGVDSKIFQNLGVQKTKIDRNFFEQEAYQTSLTDETDL